MKVFAGAYLHLCLGRFKKMGSCDFQDFGSGKNANEAFNEAVEFFGLASS